MADSPTWMELREMFLSLKSIDPVRLDWSLNTPTEAGIKAGGFEFTTWHLAQGTRCHRDELQAISLLAGVKLFQIVNSFSSEPLQVTPSRLEQYWYVMACKPPSGMAEYDVCWGVNGDTTMETIQSAVLFDAPSFFATKCLEFLAQFGEGPSPIAQTVPTVAAANPKQPKAAPAKQTWESLGGPKPSSWSDVIIWFDRDKPFSLTVEVNAMKLTVGMNDLGLGDSRYNGERSTKPFTYLTTMIANRSKVIESTRPKLEAKKRQSVNKILQEFFGLDAVPISPMHEPAFLARNESTWKEPRSIAK